MIRGDAARPATKLLIGAAALTLLAASAIHSGIAVALGAVTIGDPFPGAAIPEAVIGLALLAGLGAAFVARRDRVWLLAATVFAIAGTILGISITLGSDRGGDIAYHVVLLSGLLAALVLLVFGDRTDTHAARSSLRVLTVLDAGVFLVAAAQNLGARLAVGPVDWYFPSPIAQAGAGEAVIGLALLVAAATMRRSHLSIAYALSIFGITFGLLSQRVVGAPREIHALLVPLAVAGVMLLRSLRDPSVG